MSKKCELTGKSPLKGHKVSHANNKQKRKFFPNLKNVTFKSDILKRNTDIFVYRSFFHFIYYFQFFYYRFDLFNAILLIILEKIFIASSIMINRKDANQASSF